MVESFDPLISNFELEYWKWKKFVLEDTVSLMGHLVSQAGHSRWTKSQPDTDDQRPQIKKKLKRKNMGI